MACGCGKGGGRRSSPPIRVGSSTGLVINRGKVVANTNQRQPASLRSMAAQAKVAQQQSGDKSLGGLSKERREIDRKRRLAILSKLGKY